MRGLLFFALVALAVGPALQQINSTDSCLNNTNRGALQSVLGSFGLQLLNTAVNDTTMCGNEFRVYGSCCNISSITATVANLQSNLSNSLDFLKGDYNALINSIKYIRDQIIEVANKPVESNDFDLLKVKQAAQNILSDPFMSGYFQSHDDQASVEFNFTVDQCFNEVERQRQSAICIQCSGRANFFQADDTGNGRLAQSDSDCNAIYPRCNLAYERIVAYLQDIDFLIDLLPSYRTSFGIFNNFESVVNRARLRSVTNRLNSEAYFAIIAGGRSGTNQSARSQVCTFFTSAGNPILTDRLIGIFDPNITYVVYSIQDPVGPQEALLYNENFRLIQIARSNQTFAPRLNMTSTTNTTNPRQPYGLNYTSTGLRLPPVAFQPIKRRRLQGVNNTSPGNLGRNIVNRTDYNDELQRVNALLATISSRPSIVRRTFVDPPSPNFSVAGRPLGGAPFFQASGPLSFRTEQDLRNFVVGKAFAEVRPYDNPTATTIADYATLRLSPGLRFLTPTNLRVRP